MTDYQGTSISDEDYAKIVAALVGESDVMPKIESPPLDFLRVLESKVADHLGYPVKLSVEVMPVDALQDTTDGKVWVDIKIKYSPLYLTPEKLSALSQVDPVVFSQLSQVVSSVLSRNDLKIELYPTPSENKT